MSAMCCCASSRTRHKRACLFLPRFFLRTSSPLSSSISSIRSLSFSSEREFTELVWRDARTISARTCFALSRSRATSRRIVSRGTKSQSLARRPRRRRERSTLPSARCAGPRSSAHGRTEVDRARPPRPVAPPPLLRPAPFADGDRAGELAVNFRAKNAEFSLDKDISRHFSPSFSRFRSLQIALRRASYTRNATDIIKLHVAGEKKETKTYEEQTFLPLRDLFPFSPSWFMTNNNSPDQFPCNIGSTAYSSAIGRSVPRSRDFSRARNSASLNSHSIFFRIKWYR